MSDDLKTIATDLVARAVARGATAAEVRIGAGPSSTIEIRDGVIEKLEAGQARGLTLRVWVGDRSASSRSSDFSEGALGALAGDTVALTKLTDPVPEHAMMEAERLVDPSALPALDLYDPSVADIPTAQKIDIAREVEAVARGADPRVTRSERAYFYDSVSRSVMANSHGFLLEQETSYAGFGASVIADDEDGKKQTGSWSTGARHFADLEDIGVVGRRAGIRAAERVGSGPVATAKVPVVFEPHIASTFLGLLFSVISGRAIERRSSYLVGRVWSPVASELFTLVDDPTRVRGHGSRVCDGDGARTQRTVFVQDGVLQSYAVGTISARKLGLPPTGHGSGQGESHSNLYVPAGTRDPASIIEEVSYGFYCQGMMGFGFNPSTGDFSRGATGFLIEDGKLTRPVSEVTLSANLADILGRIDAVGSDATFDRRVVSPTIRVSEMTLGGT